jgi:hypothetical protein
VSLIFLPAPDPGPSITDWIQTGATMMGIFIAATVAVRVSWQEHERQVLHQMRKDVATAVSSIHSLHPAFSTGELIEAFNDPVVPDIDSENDLLQLREADQLLRGGTAELRSLANILQLTAPPAVHAAAQTLLELVQDFHSRIVSAHIWASLIAEGSTRPMPAFSFAELHDRIREAEVALVQVSTKPNLHGLRRFLKRFRSGR